MKAAAHNADQAEPWRRVVPVLIIVAVSFTVYFPAMNRFFVNDQLTYFLQMDGDRSLWKGLSLCDYSLARTYHKGDELLFRPLLMAWLAVQNTIFHFNYEAWNWTQLCVHAGVCLAVYRLLWVMQPSGFASLFAVLFSVLFANFEMVTWHHIGGYTIAFGLMLLALAELRRFVAAVQGGSAHPLWRYVVLMSVAAFFFEIIVPVSLLAAFYAWATLRGAGQRLGRRSALLLLVPAALFLACYSVHCLFAPRLLFTEGSPRKPAEVVTDMVKLLGTWAFRFLLPWNYEYIQDYYNRMTIHRVSPAAGIGWLVFPHVLLIAFLLPGLNGRHIRRELPFIILLVATLLIFALLVNVGRSLEVVQICTYYQYFFCLMTLVTVYAVVDWQQLSRAAGLGVVAVLLIAITMNFLRTHFESWIVFDRNKEVCEHFAKVEAAIDERKDEPGFTFAVGVAPFDLEPVSILYQGYPDERHVAGRLHFSEYMFHRYYQRRNPRYLLNQYDSGKVVLVKNEAGS